MKKALLSITAVGFLFAGMISGESQHTLTVNAAPSNPAAYADVLESILYTQAYGDLEFELMEGLNIRDNQFAVCDVNGDGKDELLVSWTESYASGAIENSHDHDCSYHDS